MRVVRSALGLLAGLALLAAPAPTPAQDKPRPERPTYVVGDRWIRSDGISDLVRIEGDRYIFASQGRREVRLTQGLALAKIVRGGIVEWEFDPPAPMAGPLEVGKWGTWYGGFRNPYQALGPPARSVWRVDGFEDIQTAAGRFKAFRIGFDIEVRLTSGTHGSAGFNPTHWQFLIWYPPEAKQLSKLEGTNAGSLGFEVVAKVGGR